MVMTAHNTRLKPGYKQTEVGEIPEDWEVCSLGDIVTKVGSGITPTGGEKVYKKEGRPFLRSQNVGWGHLLLDDIAFINEETHGSFLATEIKLNDVLLNITGASIGRSAVADDRLPGGNVNQHVCIIRTNASRLSPYYLNFFLLSESGQKQIESFQAGGNRQGLNFEQIRSFQIPLPLLSEQQAIADALSDVDALITSLDQLIAKKRDIKQATMRQLLTGKTRLPGFSGEWEVKNLDEITMCLDNLRVPLNEEQRSKIKGDYPYCGANGVLDYVNDYVIDDDIILIAEDGGYFDEYAYRPIAYRMVGKCWVNNHAHILKAREHIDQNFVYYSLVHKNILSFLASGTRAKLNKSEMYKIEINIPKSKTEQQAIATILSDMDAEIAALEQKRDKIRALKQGMMQELLTGKTRLL
jgi:type I restriction enzyme S subunit